VGHDTHPYKREELLHMQTVEPIEQAHTLALASIEDAHNIGCIVRVFGEGEPRRAHYPAAIQAGGVVIRPCHLVVVDASHEPLEVVWRIATHGVITALDGDAITLDLGYQRPTLPLLDARPTDEQTTPLTVSDEVLLHGPLREQARVVDRIVNGQPAHPERLQAALAEVVARHELTPGA